jgi:hypothetical protein
VHGYVTWQKLSFSLGKYTTAFRAKVYAIKAFTAESRDYINKNIYILSVKLQLKHLTTTKSTQKWFGTAI